MAGMKKYSPKPVHCPITTLGGAANDTPERRKRAVQCSKMMVAYVEGNASGVSVADPDDAVKYILKSVLDDALLKNEVLLLIFKQLTDCVDGPQRGPVWTGYMELLGLCLSTFPPSPELEKWVLQWLREHLRSEPARLRKFVAAVHSTKYGPVLRAPKPVAELRREWETRMQSRFSLHEGESSGPSKGQEVAVT